MSRILVTGGAGFIGGHVVDYLVGNGHTVGVCDRFTYAGKARNLQTVLAQIDLIIGDLATGDTARRCADWKPTHVIHMAAETHVDRSIDDPSSFLRSNVMGTCNLLDELRKMPEVPRRIVCYSTDEVFGPTPQGSAFRESTTFRPSNAYSASKVGVEAVATSFWVTHNLPTLIIRPCNTYGPRQHPEKVVPKFVGQIMTGLPVTLYNDGRGSRDWLHTSDHARAVELLAHEGTPGEAYNLARGDERTDEQIYRAIVQVLYDHGYGKFGDHKHPWPPQVTYIPGRPGHDRRYMMDGTKIRALGWKPIVPFSEGFESTVLWVAKNPDYWTSDVIRLKD